MSGREQGWQQCQAGPQCHSKCEFIIQSILEIWICQKRYCMIWSIIDDTWRYLAILDDTWLVSLLAFFYFLSFSARRQSRSQESRLPVVCFPRLLNLGIRSHKLTACPDGSVLIWFLRCHWLGILIECIPVSIMESRLNPKKESRSWETIIEHLCAGARRWSWRRVLDLHNQEEGRPPHWAEEDCQQTARL